MEIRRRRGRGETPSLLVLIEQYPDEIEADLQHEYGVDLLDLWRYRISARKVLNYVHRLPSESHTATAIRNSLTPEQLAVAQSGGDATRGRWSDANMLIAAVRDELVFLRHQHLIANGAKNVPDPEPMTRPGVTPKQAKGISAVQAGYLQNLRDTHKARQQAARAVTDDDTEGAPDGS